MGSSDFVSWNRDVADPLKRTSPHVLPCSAKFVRSRSNGTSVITEIRRKIGPRVPPFKVIRINTDRSFTRDFLLVINSNYGPNTSYGLWDKRRFRSKIENFPTSMYLTSPLREFPLEFFNGGSARKIKMTPTRMATKQHVHSFIQHRRWSDAQTDWQKW